MTSPNLMGRIATSAAVGALVLTGCASAEDNDSTPQSEPDQTTSAPATPNNDAGAHDHNPEGGPPPEGIAKASDPTYEVGETVILTVDHMPGMEGSEATISGAFDTTTYSVSYTPTDGGEPVTDHKWVVHEELVDPGESPLEPGDGVVLNADHMSGMDGAQATIDSSTDETVYMVDLEMDGMVMTHHKWVVEGEMQAAG